MLAKFLILPGFFLILTSFCAMQTAQAAVPENGQALFEKKCHQCHKQPDPSKPPPEGWAKKLEKMGKFARLKKGQKADVLAYLQDHSKTETIKAIVSNDRQLLEEKCTVCHSLGRIQLENFDGDIGKHILDRMQSYSGEQNINNEDLTKILSYLQDGKELKKPERIKTDDPAKLFAARCSACHSLERVFNRIQAGDNIDSTWTHIISRMRNKSPDWITEDESKKLAAYLNSLSSKNQN